MALLLLLSACAGNSDRRTLVELHDVEPDMTEVRVENSLEQAIVGYRKFLAEAPKSELTPEAMRRLADLKLEKEYGILGDGELPEVPAPATDDDDEAAPGSSPAKAAVAVDLSEGQEEFERRATGEQRLEGFGGERPPDLPGGRQEDPPGPLEAIALYDEILATYPRYPHADQVLYQKARAFDELGRVDEAIEVIDLLVASYPHSRHLDEVQFRRAEYFFVRKEYLDAEESYLAITRIGESSDYYELALYKLGWAFYKQELHREAVQQYVKLLDYKVSAGFDFDQTEDEADERRIADTFRVVSLSFSSLGGSRSVQEFFAANEPRDYEDRVYSHLGEFYLEKLRYADAADAYQTFVTLHPLHRRAPHFGMRIVEIYETGGFPKLVLESKKDFAARYGLTSEYWRHFAVEKSPEVLHYLRENLKDLASHYHALHQEEDLAEERPANFAEALRWYRSYLTSFPKEEETPSIHYRMADLLLENEGFGEAAREYEQTAYGYPEHEQAAGAGYAAIYSHRQNEKTSTGAEQEVARRDAVASTLRFADAFPAHEHVAAVLGAAVDDLYDMKDYELAIATGRRLIEGYPDAELPIRRAAWAAIAHSSFDLADFPGAEDAYLQVLAMNPGDDEKRQSFVDNLAASIYKQGEQASDAEDHRAAADHFLRVAASAPSSSIRPTAEYDAGAALIQLEEWGEAARVLDAFRDVHPEHELQEEATKQIALVYRKQGELSRAADEYARVAAEAEDPELQRDALLLAGELYEQAGARQDALAAYLRYVDAFPEPLESAVETRFKIAEMYEKDGETSKRREELRRIIDLDASSASARTPRTRYLAARSALVLTESTYDDFLAIELVQPFEKSLERKQRQLDRTLAAFGKLVDYEVGEVTAAATYYMAQVYFEFGRSLMESERPAGLSPAELQDYELVLEEEAFPFEERAIEVHQKNLELMSTGVYNPWIEKSLAELAQVMPGRYAKFESSSGWLASIHTYAYHAPQPPPAPASEVLTEVVPEPEVEKEMRMLPAEVVVEDEIHPTQEVVEQDVHPAEPAPVDEERAPAEVPVEENAHPAEPEATAETNPAGPPTDDEVHPAASAPDLGAPDEASAGATTGGV